MSLVAKLSAEVLAVAPHHKHHGVWVGRPHHVPNVSPSKIPKVILHGGEWGSVGSVVAWHYVIDGKDHVAKDVVEAIDEENKTITYRVIEGDVLQEYKSFKLIIQNISIGEATWVRWTLEYEKLNKNIPHPIKLLELVIHLSEELDDHLVQA